MHIQSRIQALDVDQRIFVLKDADGNSLGTGSREALEVLLYVVNLAQKLESRFQPSANSRVRAQADVRSALVF
jgi:hypothetical protein